MLKGSNYEGGHLLENLLLFGRVCKLLGMDVSPERMTDASQALQYVNLGSEQDVYDTLRAVIVSRQRDLWLFDEAFHLFWRTPIDEWVTLELPPPINQKPRPKPQVAPPAAASENPSDGDKSTKPPDSTVVVLLQTYSHDELLRRKNFAEMTGEEITEARQMMERLRWSLGQRKTRRLVPGKGDLLDMRRSFRENMRYMGEPLRFPTRTPKIKPRPLVLLCDISGSMERYTRLLLHFMHTLAQGVYQVESFVFATRLTRITRPLRHKSIDATLHEVGVNVKDWGGGTRIGDAVHEFNYRWSRRVLGRGAVVIVITDGWDRGDPATLREEMLRLQRNAYRVIWLNPLIGGPQYEPLTRGAQAMLPYVDDFLPVRNLTNLESLTKELNRVEWRRPERSAHAHLIATPG